jgi:hypothetical protein
MLNEHALQVIPWTLSVVIIFHGCCAVALLWLFAKVADVF